MYREKQAGCEAYQISDQMRCERCNLLWDINDIDPPNCKNGHDLFEAAKAQLHEVNQRAKK